jgi:hypothetical protein
MSDTPAMGAPARLGEIARTSNLGLHLLLRWVRLSRRFWRLGGHQHRCSVAMNPAIEMKHTRLCSHRCGAIIAYNLPSMRSVW